MLGKGSELPSVELGSRFHLFLAPWTPPPSGCRLHPNSPTPLQGMRAGPQDYGSSPPPLRHHHRPPLEDYLLLFLPLFHVLFHHLRSLQMF